VTVQELIDKLVALEYHTLDEDLEVVVSEPSGESGSIKMVVTDFDGDGKRYVHISA